MDEFEERKRRISEFRMTHGRNPDDAEYLEIVGRIRVGSKFSRWT